MCKTRIVTLIKFSLRFYFIVRCIVLLLKKNLLSLRFIFYSLQLDSTRVILLRSLNREESGNWSLNWIFFPLELLYKHFFLFLGEGFKTVFFFFFVGLIFVWFEINTDNFN